MWNAWVGGGVYFALSNCISYSSIAETSFHHLGEDIGEVYFICAIIIHYFQTYMDCF